MSDPLRRIVVVLAAGILVLGVVVAVSLELGPQPPTFSAAPIPRVPTSGPDETIATRTFRDYSLVPGDTIRPLGKALESRLWQIDGVWWAVLLEPKSRTTHIFRLASDGTAWTDTGIVVDERPGAVADALWDGGHLYVATAVPGRARENGGRVTRFSPTADGFAMDPNFPIRLGERGLTAISVTRDSSGRLWAAFVQDSAVRIAHSLDDDAVWSPPAQLPSATDRVGEADLATLVTMDNGQVGILWTRTEAHTVSFAVRGDADPLDRWSPAEVALRDMPLSDNPISLKAVTGGRVAATVELSADAGSSGGADPHAVAIVRDPGGTWRAALLARVEDHLGPPTLLADADGKQIHVLASSPRAGGQVYLKSAEVERLEFAAGRGVPVMTDPSDPNIADPTSTKQPVSLEAGIVVAAFDRTSGTIWHSVIGTGRVAAASPSPSAGGSATLTSPPSPPPAAPVKTIYIDDNFDPWPLDQPIGNGWVMRSEDPPDALRAGAEPGTNGRHAVLRTATGTAVRACKSFTPVTAGTLVIRERVRFDAQGASDMVIGSVRDPGGESASVRFGQGGTFAYYAGQVKVRTTVPARAGTWYRSILRVRPAAGTYDWTLTTDGGDVLVRVAQIKFRDAEASEASSLCVQTADGKAGLTMRFDDVVVSD